MSEIKEQKYDGLSAEELEQRLRDSFFCPDRIDETVFQELEELRSALERIQPAEEGPDPEEAWARFLEDRAEELEALWGSSGEAPRPRAARAAGHRPRAILRRILIAAAAAVLLAGAALAADSLGLMGWTARWNPAAGRYAPAALEEAPERPIPAALKELGIGEPVYPAHIPEGFTLTESRVSADPLVLMEQYAREDQRLSITITPIEGFKTVLYQAGGGPQQEDSGSGVHYLFKNAGTITAVWYTNHYVTSVSGDITRAEIKRIIDSIAEGAAQ